MRPAVIFVARPAENSRLKLQDDEVAQELTKVTHHTLGCTNTDNTALLQVLIKVNLVALSLIKVRIQDAAQVPVGDNLGHLSPDAGGILIHLGPFSIVFVDEPAGNIDIFLLLSICLPLQLPKPGDQFTTILVRILEDGVHIDEGCVFAIDAFGFV